MNFYNEINPYCCDWLENLIREGLIPDGVVDRRSIVDILPAELKRFTQCHFFAGLGGWPLALRLATYPDHRKVWTGSCPCQPFSTAGKRLGFADDRHLWPYWRYLIAVGRPPIVLGEQVASASAWLRLVRGDLEALDYAVGAIPIEAASAGADHLRDRFWFVADQSSERRDGSSNSSRQAGRDCAEDSRTNGVAQGDAHEPGPQGWNVHPERAGERTSGTAGMEHATRLGRSEGRTESELRSGWDATSKSGFPFDMGNPVGAGTGRVGGSGFGAQAPGGGERQFDGNFHNAPVAPDTEWVLGADGKARRVKSGIRLLAHGVPSRVAKLRALGNAIDPRPAAAFIKAALTY